MGRNGGMSSEFWMKRSPVTCVPVCCLAALVFGGCAPKYPNNYGGTLQKAGHEMKLFGDEWQKGDALEARGLSIKASGEAQMEAARHMEEDGARRAEQGRRMAEEGATMKRAAEEKARRREVNGTSYVGH